MSSSIVYPKTEWVGSVSAIWEASPKAEAISTGRTKEHVILEIKRSEIPMGVYVDLHKIGQSQMSVLMRPSILSVLRQERSHIMVGGLILWTGLLTFNPAIMFAGVGAALIAIMDHYLP